MRETGIPAPDFTVRGRFFVDNWLRVLGSFDRIGMQLPLYFHLRTRSRGEVDYWLNYGIWAAFALWARRIVLRGFSVQTEKAGPF